MKEESKLWYLSHFSLLKRLKMRELMYLNDNSVMYHHKKSDNVFDYYNENRHIYFIKKGTLKLTRVTQEGKELLTYLIPKGSIFGLTNLLTNKIEGDEVMTAVQDSIVCKVSMPLFKELMERNSELNNYVLKLSGLRIKKLENKLENILFKTADDRIEEFLISFPQEYGEDKGEFYESSVVLTNKDIASLTNSNRQKVNQVMNEMKRSGIIDFDTKSIKYFKQTNK